MRYLVFGMDNFYPAGGMDDLLDRFNSAILAVAYIKNIEHEYQDFHVYDTKTGKIYDWDYNRKKTVERIT